MYKRLSQFLQQFRRPIAYFGNWGRTPVGAAKRSAEKIPGQAIENPLKSQHQKALLSANEPDFIDELPWVPLLAEDAQDLWLGSSDFRAQEFFRTAKHEMLSIGNIKALTCADIAVRLNEMRAALPRNREWDSRLVYHFTRRYTKLRPSFFDDTITTHSTCNYSSAD